MYRPPHEIVYLRLYKALKPCMQCAYKENVFAKSSCFSEFCLKNHIFFFALFLFLLWILAKVLSMLCLVLLAFSVFL